MEVEYDTVAQVAWARTPDGKRFVLRTHEPDKCAGEFCTIHNPSARSAAIGWLNWRTDRGIMERICRHGVGHYDYDQYEYHKRLLGKEAADAEAVHGCCGYGCCDQ